MLTLSGWHAEEHAHDLKVPSLPPVADQRSTLHNSPGLPSCLPAFSSSLSGPHFLVLLLWSLAAFSAAFFLRLLSSEDRHTCDCEVPTVCALYAILPRCLVDRPWASSRRVCKLSAPLPCWSSERVFPSLPHFSSPDFQSCRDRTMLTVTPFSFHPPPPPFVRYPPSHPARHLLLATFFPILPFFASPCFSLHALSILVAPFRSRAIPFENRSR